MSDFIFNQTTVIEFLTCAHNFDVPLEISSLKACWVINDVTFYLYE